LSTAHEAPQFEKTLAFSVEEYQHRLSRLQAASARVAAELTQCKRRLGYACFNGVAHERKRLIRSLGNRGSPSAVAKWAMALRRRSGYVPRWYHEDGAETLVCRSC